MRSEDQWIWQSEFKGEPPQFIIVDGERTLGWERVDGDWWCPSISRIVKASELKEKPKLTLEQRVKRLEDLAGI
jgi:hypothetical protein